MTMLPSSAIAFMSLLCSISLYPYLDIAPSDSVKLYFITWPAPCEMALCFEKQYWWMKGGI